MPDILAESLLMTSSSPHLRFLDLLADHSFFDPPPISAPFSIASLTTSQMALLCPASSWSTSAHFSPSQSPLWSHPKRLSALSALLLALLLLSPFLVTTWTHPKHSAMPCCQLAAEALAHCFPDPPSNGQYDLMPATLPPTSEKYDQDSYSCLKEPPTNQT